jgi:hypothetical protein
MLSRCNSSRRDAAMEDKRVLYVVLNRCCESVASVVWAFCCEYGVLEWTWTRTMEWVNLLA